MTLSLLILRIDPVEESPSKIWFFVEVDRAIKFFFDISFRIRHSRLVVSDGLPVDACYTPLYGAITMTQKYKSQDES